MDKKAIEERNLACKAKILAIKDTTDLLSGKWKVFILGSLLVMGKMRFMELLNSIDGIGRKMLAKELDDLQVNGLITRTALKTKPITVEYELTERGKSFKGLMDEIILWGENYRRSLYK
ncbi:transcriptional regulator [Empedobacter brevis NBRC 14943 = ATCC 43319]|uniref:Transcriptional regulator n=1 Tax=Empedobacter brevis NBRC 14943 = ATCC 43319 TaxID=1218108 RepID=A0A511NGV0_9FLAO|nr:MULTISPECIES: helix-turn-helix domain-containing protein [Empedobacter]GEM51481.1 transcriptional regulator [Empedobacter brevis NBRC 14943 = ATCC 43319]